MLGQEDIANSSPSPAPAPSATITAASPQPPPKARTPPAVNNPTSEEIDAVIQAATSQRQDPDGKIVPLKDTRTQLFVGNLPYRVRWQDLKDLFRKAGTVLRADVALGPDNRSRGYGTVLLATAEDAGRAVDMFNGYSWQTRVLEVRLDRLPADFSSSSSAAAAASPDPFHHHAHSHNHLAAPYPVAPPPFGLPFSSAVAQAQAQAQAAAASRPISSSGAGALSPRPPFPPSLLDEPFAFSPSASNPSTASPAPPPFLQPDRVSRTLFVGNLPFHVQWQDLKDLFRPAGTILRADVALGPDGRSRGFGSVVYATDVDAERAVRVFNGYEYSGRVLKVHFDKYTPHLAASPSPAPIASLAALSALRDMGASGATLRELGVSSAALRELGAGGASLRDLGASGASLRDLGSSSGLRDLGSSSGLRDFGASASTSRLLALANANAGSQDFEFEGDFAFSHDGAGSASAFAFDADDGSFRPASSSSALRFRPTTSPSIGGSSFRPASSGVGAAVFRPTSSGAPVTFRPTTAESGVRAFGTGGAPPSRVQSVHAHSFAQQARSQAQLSHPHPPQLHARSTGAIPRIGRDDVEGALARTFDADGALARMGAERDRERRVGADTGSWAGLGLGGGGGGADGAAQRIGIGIGVEQRLAAERAALSDAAAARRFIERDAAPPHRSADGAWPGAGVGASAGTGAGADRARASELPTPPSSSGTGASPVLAAALGARGLLNGAPGVGGLGSLLSSPSEAAAARAGASTTSPRTGASASPYAASPHTGASASPLSGGSSRTSPALANGSAKASPQASQHLAASPQGAQHTSPRPADKQQRPAHHQHPAHPGPIALPPPSAAFALPAAHTMSPASPYLYVPPSPMHAPAHAPGAYLMHPHPYTPLAQGYAHRPPAAFQMQGSPLHHPAAYVQGSPLHHPAAAYAALGVLMTPHGLPPITPSMPSFQFHPHHHPPQPVPIPAPDAMFSPGVTMSPGAFWGRPERGAWDAAPGAPLKREQQQQQQPQQQHQHQQHQHQQQLQQQGQGQQQQQQQQQGAQQEPPDYFAGVGVGIADEILRGGAGEIRRAEGTAKEERGRELEGVSGLIERMALADTSAGVGLDARVGESALEDAEDERPPLGSRAGSEPKGGALGVSGPERRASFAQVVVGGSGAA